jgi:aspartate racemase
MSKTIGIIGGMGPESTIYLMKKIVDYTNAKREQDHIRMLVDNRPQIPDRTDYILGKGPSPIPDLVDSANLLVQMGADVLVIACNTAHAFIDEIQKQVKVEFLDMLRLLTSHIKNEFPIQSRIGLLATSGALKINLFQQYMYEYILVTPDKILQEKNIMEAIYGKDGIKVGGNLIKNREKIFKVIDNLKKQNIDLLVTGCTEIGLALDNTKIGIPILNPLNILAQEIIRVCS